MTKHFLCIGDLGQDALRVLERAAAMKKEAFRGTTLQDKVVVLIFEKASTRTRMSFEVAVRQLGGSTIFMTPVESQLGRSEPLRDTARVLSRYVDCMVVRTFAQSKLDELIRYGTVPVVNALTDEGHPCQILADILTIYENTPNLAAQRVAWVGDGNNVANSWIEASVYFPFELCLAVPKGYEPDMALFERAQAQGAKVSLTRSPQEAVQGATYVTTDVWASMGQEAEQAERVAAFAGFCVDTALMRQAAPNAKFLHCLPAHRGEEVSEEVLESSVSLVWDEAENRLHAQKAVLEWLFT